MTNDSSRVLGLRFEPPVNYTFGFAIPRIYEYDDDHDNVDLNDNTYMVVHKFTESTKWQVDLDKSAAQVTYTAHDSIIFKVGIMCVLKFGQNLVVRHRGGSILICKEGCRFSMRWCM